MKIENPNDECLNEFEFILNDKERYVLIKNDNSKYGYFIFNKIEQGRILIEKSLEELIREMLNKNFRIFNSIDDIRDDSIVRYVYILDEEKKQFIKVTADEAQQRMQKNK